MSELTTMTPTDAAPDAAPDSTAVSPERRRAILAQVIQLQRSVQLQTQAVILGS